MKREGFIFLKPVFKEMIIVWLRNLAMIYRGMTRESAGESVPIRMAIVPL